MKASYCLKVQKQENNINIHILSSCMDDTQFIHPTWAPKGVWAWAVHWRRPGHAQRKLLLCSKTQAANQGEGQHTMKEKQQFRQWAPVSHQAEMLSWSGNTASRKPSLIAADNSHSCEHFSAHFFAHGINLRENMLTLPLPQQTELTAGGPCDLCFLCSPKT